ncbi:hypothetical protein ACFU7Y_32175 [Kitasatospora sp. NPDC057542]|uniref:hypothetical protein n=1 Tax=Streptomycetaceae TaxID=2062 RepID=UPI001CCCF10B|nr:hypothetical protein [Streptomyces sp. LS1784]
MVGLAPVLYVTHTLEFWELLLIAAAHGALSEVYETALLPTIAGPEQLVQING